jgi:Lrp/AsnC family transcriptional regulator
VDATDAKILRTIQSHPELSIVDLAEKVGLSHTPCWRRLRRLESEGFIVRRAVILDPRKLGFTVDVYAYIKIGKHDETALDQFEEQVLGHPEIVECFSMSGESDYVMRILAKSIEDYERFLKKVLLHLPGVASINSSFALKSIKLTTDVPL